MLERVNQGIAALDVAKMRAASRTRRRIEQQEEERKLEIAQKEIESGSPAKPSLKKEK